MSTLPLSFPQAKAHKIFVKLNQQRTDQYVARYNFTKFLHQLREKRGEGREERGERRELRELRAERREERGQRREKREERREARKLRV